jgi:hypothetical protein
MMPILNYASPLFVSSSSALSYTAVKDCYVLYIGSNLSSGGRNLKINNTVVAGFPSSVSSNLAFMTPMLKIKAGDVVTTTDYSPTNWFKVFEEV